MALQVTTKKILKRTDSPCLNLNLQHAGKTLKKKGIRAMSGRDRGDKNHVDNQNLSSKHDMYTADD